MSNKQARVLFRLRMPRKGSWDGKWSGDDENYTLVRILGTKALKLLKLKEGGIGASWRYDFGDGWAAVVSAQVLAPRVRPKKGDGFCGYEWMVDSILHCGHIERAA